MMSGSLDMVEKNHSRFLVGNRELGLCLMTFCILGVALLSYVTKFSIFCQCYMLVLIYSSLVISFLKLDIIEMVTFLKGHQSNNGHQNENHFRRLSFILTFELKNVQLAQNVNSNSMILQTSQAYFRFNPRKIGPQGKILWSKT